MKLFGKMMAVILAAVMVAAITPAFAAETADVVFDTPVSFTFASAGKAGSTDASMVEEWIDRIQTESGGMITVDYQPGAALGNQYETFQQTVDIFPVQLAVFTEQFPAGLALLEFLVQFPGFGSSLAGQLFRLFLDFGQSFFYIFFFHDKVPLFFIIEHFRFRVSPVSGSHRLSLTDGRAPFLLPD